MIKNLKNLAELTGAVTKARQVLQLPLENVISKPQVRVQFRNLDELAASMAEEGQQSPIIVSAPNLQGQYVIQKGERRWRAAKIAGLASIDAIINHKEQNATELLAGQLVENIQRDDLTALEIAVAIGQLIDAGWSQRKIAQHLGKSASYVSIYATLVDLDESLKSLHDEGIVTDASSLATLHKMYERDEAQTLAFAEEIKTKGSATRSEIRQKMTQLQAPTTEAKSVKPTQQAAPKKELAPNESESAQKVEPQDFVIEVLVSEEAGDEIGQLMIGYVPSNNDTAWVLIDNKPVEVNVTAITILEVRSAKP